jgi:hypothetical protein
VGDKSEGEATYSTDTLEDDDEASAGEPARPKDQPQASAGPGPAPAATPLPPPYSYGGGFVGGCPPLGAYVDSGLDVSVLATQALYRRQLAMVRQQLASMRYHAEQSSRAVLGYR